MCLGVRAKLAAMDVDIIAQRPQTLTAQGNTKPDFSHEDPKDTHHASAKYGAMVFEDVIDYAKKAGFA